jgi:signal transduction histidine kinase
MTRRLVATYVVVTAFALALLAVPLGVTFANHERDRFLSEMEADADNMAALAAHPIDTNAEVPSVDILRYALRTGAHVIVVDRRGIALLDTAYPQPGRNYSTRPEIQQALEGHRLQGRRRSDTARTTLLYAAVPTSARGRVNGAVRITYPTRALDSRVRRVWGALVLLCLGVLAAAALVGFVLARGIVRPIRHLERAADRAAAGDLTVRVEDATGPPELRHLARTFNRMAERLAGLLDAQQRFVADASHQLRTPLTALRLRLENLDARVPTADRAAVAAATAEVTRMSRLTDGLLVLAREEADTGTPVPTDLARVVRERASGWEDVASEDGVHLDVDAPSAAWARSIPGATEQIVDNLVDNALAVSPRGTRVCLRVERAATEIALHVIDEGPGLDADERARAFDRFWRAPDAPPGGSGLGLAIVRQLAEASGGRARLDAAPGGGTDAVVVLPAFPAGAEPAPRTLAVS